ncbi:hypothetical protein CSB20_12090 [bacterium DOLZORAL124_64_63]|nr:MAG: hypothetical protein CSB20_12090 [bacterium DOLZORAL124_64_63]
MGQNSEELRKLTNSLLARVRIWTILVALVAALMAWFAVSSIFAIGLFLTALWGVVGLLALEGILRSLVVPQGQPRNGLAAILWILLKLAVYGLAIGVLFSRPFPAVSHAVGFTLLMVTLVGVGATERSGNTRQMNRRDDDA